MPDHQKIYTEQAAQYELLVSREDYHHNLWRALNQIIPFRNLQVVEFGAGTGRLTNLLAPVVQSISAFDRSAHMLTLAAEKLKESGRENWQTVAGEHRQMPIRNGIADVVLSGWSVCYLVVENPESWRAELQRALHEMFRVVRLGGLVVLVETLGTGVETPTPPAGLVAYYEYLEANGFQRNWLRTDYRFRDRAEAEKSARFFFGEAMVEKIQADERGVILPECTGIWSKPKDAEL